MRRIDGIVVSAPARALLEIAPELSSSALADAVERAQVKQLVTKRELVAAIERAPWRAGVAALRALAEDEAFTRSHAERELVALLRAARLPEPIFNAVVESWEVDAFWARERVVLELDSYGFHATRAAFERDRRKTADLTRNGYVVLRSTWTELTKHSHALIARTAEALALSGGRLRVAHPRPDLLRHPLGLARGELLDLLARGVLRALGQRGDAFGRSRCASVVGASISRSQLGSRMSISPSRRRRWRALKNMKASRPRPAAPYFA